MGLQLASGFYTNSKLATDRIRILQEELPLPSVRDEPLAKHTSLRIGGPADLFVTATTTTDLITAVNLARECQVPCFVLGGGTNVLVSDRGVRGIVLANQCRAFATRFVSEPSAPSPVADHLQCIVRAESGVSLPNLARYTARLGLTGLEWAVGIPGTIGGAIVNNAGAFGTEIKDILQKVTILDPSGTTSTWETGQLDFGYRTSRLKRNPGPIVLEATFHLYREAVTTVAARVNEYTERRKKAQPKGPSAGSVFANPPGDYAGRLIEQAGLKGLRIGDAQVSTEHANFIINIGQATASDVYTLILKIHEEVRRQFGISLDLEIQLVGDWPEWGGC